ncbi:hypothetical protein J6590_034091 [Homalodisca vitripennis]|nr:hypothetical protein J6590_034091 [Homalodisca vitripennis]
MNRSEGTTQNSRAQTTLHTRINEGGGLKVVTDVDTRLESRDSTRNRFPPQFESGDIPEFTEFVRNDKAELACLRSFHELETPENCRFQTEIESSQRPYETICGVSLTWELPENSSFHRQKDPEDIWNYRTELP